MNRTMNFAHRHGRSAALLLALFATAACKDPRAVDVFTLKAPTALTTQGVCLIQEAAGWRAAFADDEDCVHPTELTSQGANAGWDPHVYAALISNEGEGALQIYSLDTRSTIWLSALRSSLDCLEVERGVRQPGIYNGSWTAEMPGDAPCSTIPGTGVRALDNNRTVPGNNGIPIAGTVGPNTPAPFPGVHLVAANAPNAIHAINWLDGSPVTVADTGQSALAVDFPITALGTIRETGWIIAANARDNELVAWQPTLLCDGQSEHHMLGCELTIAFGTPQHIALDAAPQHLATSELGDVYVSMIETPWITRISLDDNECPPTAPCRISITHTCNDGLDNDGNGLADNEDPSCYTPYQDEGELFADLPCADGVDNDGDGLIDALDPQCASRSASAEDGAWDTCADGVDNDGDDRVDADDPNCVEGTEFSGGGGIYTPPSDATLPRYERATVFPGVITVSAEGDIVAVTEAGSNRAHADQRAPELILLCGRPIADAPDGYLCQEANSRIHVNDGDPVRDAGLGISLSGLPTTVLATTTVETLPIRNPDNITPNLEGADASVLTLQTRRINIATTEAALYSVDIDRIWIFVDENGDLVREYEPLTHLTDAAHSPAEVRNLRTINAERVPGLPAGYTPQEPGVNAFYPSLYAIDPTKVGGQPGDKIRLTPTTAIIQGAWVGLETEDRFCFDIKDVGCVPNPPRDRSLMPYTFARKRTAVPNDPRLFDENWRIEWEGSLLINTSGIEYTAQRTDAVVLNDDGWVRFLGQNACERVNNDGQTLCDFQIGWAVCEELEGLCKRGADLCADDIDLCQICPQACAQEVNLCAAGVQPGDILIIPPIDPAGWCKRGESGCTRDDIPAQCLPNAATNEPGAYDIKIPAAATIGNEYRVVEVKGDAVRVEPLAFTNRTRYRLPTQLPSPTCYRRPFTAEIVAANSWTFGGTRVLRSDTAMVEQDDICTWDATSDGVDRIERPVAAVETISRLGLKFDISPGEYLRWCETQADAAECAHAMRGFRILFSVEDNYSPRYIAGAVGTMALASSTIYNRNLVMPLMLFVDASTNQLTVLPNDEKFDGTIVP